MIRRIILFMMVLFVSGGCVKRSLVPFEQVDEANSVVVTQVSGHKSEGTVVRMEPHQLTLRRKDDSRKVIAKSSVRTIKRKPPVYDDYGRGISEEDITSKKRGRYSFIYGVGGGVLCYGASFFIGSMIGEDSGETMAAITLGGGTLGTWLFVRGGKKKDRITAIETICEERRHSELNKRNEEGQKKTEALKKVLEEEKAKQEALRKEREELLRKLDDNQEN